MRLHRSKIIKLVGFCYQSDEITCDGNEQHNSERRVDIVDQLTDDNVVLPPLFQFGYYVGRSVIRNQDFLDFSIETGEQDGSIVD